MSTISVALCTYNSESFIGEQLWSIYNSTVVPNEIVVSDDISKDRTCEIVSTWLARGPEIRLLENSNNLGVTKNFENALSATQGDLIFLSDHDDKWHPNKVKLVVDTFQRRPDLLLLHTNARLVDAAGEGMGCSLFEALELSQREIKLIKHGNAFNAFLRRNLVTGATAAIRRDLLEAALPFPVEWVHDEWLAIIASAIGKVDFLNEKLIDYRQHGGNQIGMRKLTLPEKIKKALKPREDFHQRQVRRTEVLLERLLVLGTAVPAKRVELVREKLLHHKMRARLPANRLKRIVPILREILTGRYGKYSTGFRSIIRDLFEPA